MTKAFSGWLKIFIAALVSAYFLPGVIVSGFPAAFLAAAVLGAANFFFRGLLAFLAIPISIFTVGFFGFLMNLAVLSVISAVVSGFRVEGFFWAMVFSAAISLFLCFLPGL